MKKRYPALVLLCALLLPLLCGCSPSPTAVTVGNRKVDASEYAFYLNYNRLSTGEESGTVLFDEEDNALAREAALDQILTGEVVRLKCEEFGLELSANQRKALQSSKEQLVESLGGKAAYLKYLQQSCLTDRAYDKFQENDYYSAMLYNYMMTDSESYYTDESLRQYFTTHYATVKYIFFSFLDPHSFQPGTRCRLRRVDGRIQRGRFHDLRLPHQHAGGRQHRIPHHPV